MRKMIAVMLFLSFLLCGCEKAENSVSDSLPPEAPVTSVAESTAETDSAHSEEASETPQELAKRVWDMVEEVGNSYTASDYDVFMSTEMDLDGSYSYAESNMRIKEIKTDTGSIIYCSVKGDGTNSEIWYADETYYQSSSFGNFKFPMTAEELATQTETATASDTILMLDLSNFGTCFASQQGEKYAVTFRDPTLDTWMAFADMFTSNGLENSECTAFEMDGYLQCDLEGNMDRLEADMTITLNIDGTPMTMVVYTTQFLNGYNDRVSIDVPYEDESFMAMNDPMIPDLLFSGVPMATSVSALDYMNTSTFTFSDNLSMEEVIREDRLVFRLDEQGLEADLDTLVTYNYDMLFERGSEVSYWRTDAYRFGEGTVSDPDGTQTYTCTADEFLSSTLGLVYDNLETYEYGSNFRLMEDGDRMKVVYALSEDYAREVIRQQMENYVPDYPMEDAHSVVPSGVMTYWFDENGIMVEQELFCRAETHFEDQLFTVMYKNAGLVLATNDDVAVGNTAN